MRSMYYSVENHEGGLLATPAAANAEGVVGESNAVYTVITASLPRLASLRVLRVMQGARFQTA